MAETDLFGLDREMKILKSKVREVFTPHQPIHSVKLFFGRQREVQKIIEQINTPGQHSLLYGDRGVGKSSLANIATQLLISKLITGKLYTKRCDSSDTFETAIEEPLIASGFDPSLVEQYESVRKSGEAGINQIVKAAGRVEKETAHTYRFERTLSPSLVAKAFQNFNGLLYLDESDALASLNDKHKLAELIKQLSDNGSGFKILVVGIAETAAELTGGHPSVHRCLKETKLGRMPPEELSLIIAEGASKLRLQFEKDVIESIVRVSSGYPHFTHLLALKCAEEAITQGKKKITSEDLKKSMLLSVEDAEGTLRRQYKIAVRSFNTQMYERILLAAARLNKDEFAANELREEVDKITGTTNTQAKLNNFLKRLVSDTEETILVRKAKGMYKFADPRMPSYVKIANKEIE